MLDTKNGGHDAMPSSTDTASIEHCRPLSETRSTSHFVEATDLGLDSLASGMLPNSVLPKDIECQPKASLGISAHETVPTIDKRTSFQESKVDSTVDKVTEVVDGAEGNQEGLQDEGKKVSHVDNKVRNCISFPSLVYLYNMYVLLCISYAYINPSMQTFVNACVYMYAYICIYACSVIDVCKYNTEICLYKNVYMYILFIKFTAAFFL